MPSFSEVCVVNMSAGNGAAVAVSGRVLYSLPPHPHLSAHEEAETCGWREGGKQKRIHVSHFPEECDQEKKQTPSR